MKLNDEVTILGLPGGEQVGKVVSLEPLKVKVKAKIVKHSYDQPLPDVLDTLEFRVELANWLEYKGRSAYKPGGLRALISQAANRATEFGVSAVVNAMLVARSNDWKGWNFDGSFQRKGKDRSDPRGNISTLNSFINGSGGE